jgi:hypothetical protein
MTQPGGFNPVKRDFTEPGDLSPGPGPHGACVPNTAAINPEDIVRQSRYRVSLEN